MTRPGKEKLADVRYEYRRGYLYAFVSGEKDSLSISRDYWQRVIEECNRRGSGKLLVEEDFPNQIDIMDMFSLVIDVSQFIIRPLQIAFVDRDLVQDGLNRFGETVAINRGVYVCVFKDRAAAERWLQEQGEHRPPPDYSPVPAGKQPDETP